MLITAASWADGYETRDAGDERGGAGAYRPAAPQRSH